MSVPSGDGWTFLADELWWTMEGQDDRDDVLGVQRRLGFMCRESRLSGKDVPWVDCRVGLGGGVTA